MGKLFIDHWRDAVWADETLTATEKLLLLGYAQFADYGTGANVRPGQALMSRLTHVSKRTISPTTERLVDLGWMVCVEQGRLTGAGQLRKASRYQLTFPNDEASSPFRSATDEVDVWGPMKFETSTDEATSHHLPYLPTTTSLASNGEAASSVPCPTCHGNADGFSGGFCPTCKVRAA